MQQIWDTNQFSRLSVLILKIFHKIWRVHFRGDPKKQTPLNMSIEAQFKAQRKSPNAADLKRYLFDSVMEGKLFCICDETSLSFCISDQQTTSEIHSVGDFPLPCLNISRAIHLTTARKPLCLLVEEPEVGGPEEAVEEAEEDGDVAFGELGTGAAAFNSYRVLFAKKGNVSQTRAHIF